MSQSKFRKMKPTIREGVLIAIVMSVCVAWAIEHNKRIRESQANKTRLEQLKLINDLEPRNVILEYSSSGSLIRVRVNDFEPMPSLRKLSQLTTIESIDLSMSYDLQDEDLRFLHRIDSLKTLILPECFGMRPGQDSKAIVRYVGRLSNLERLHIDASYLTDEDILEVCGSLELKLLQVDGRTLPERTLRQLFDSNPQLEIKNLSTSNYPTAMRTFRVYPSESSLDGWTMHQEADAHPGQVQQRVWNDEELPYNGYEQEVYYFPETMTRFEVLESDRTIGRVELIVPIEFGIPYQQLATRQTLRVELKRAGEIDELVVNCASMIRTAAMNCGMGDIKLRAIIREDEAGERLNAFFIIADRKGEFDMTLVNRPTLSSWGEIMDRRRQN